MKPLKYPKIMLVYQNGLANLFAVDEIASYPYWYTSTPNGPIHHHRNAKRLLQSSFTACQTYALACVDQGAEVRTAACNKAGDITDEVWSFNLSDELMNVSSFE